MFATQSDFERRRAVLPFYGKNEKAVAQFEATNGPIADAFATGNVTDRISYLRLLGFACARCGGGITWPVLRFFRYSADAKCYDCQKS